jgi:hypothetical protein
MGYACPVCEDPQADDVHLANHLAFTAMTGGDDHEAWLDDRVSDWGELGPAELAEEVVDHADETEFPQVFEDTTDDAHDHGDHAHTDPSDLPPGAQRQRGSRSLSDDDRDVLAEARDLTREMLNDDEDTDDGDDAAGDETE